MKVTMKITFETKTSKFAFLHNTTILSNKDDTVVHVGETIQIKIIFDNDITIKSICGPLTRQELFQIIMDVHDKRKHKIMIPCETAVLQENFLNIRLVKKTGTDNDNYTIRDICTKMSNECQKLVKITPIKTIDEMLDKEILDMETKDDYEFMWSASRKKIDTPSLTISGPITKQNLYNNIMDHLCNLLKLLIIGEPIHDDYILIDMIYDQASETWIVNTKPYGK